METIKADINLENSGSTRICSAFSRPKIWAAYFCLIFMACFADAQQPSLTTMTGIPPNTAIQSSDIDTINITGRSVHLNIPIFSTTYRGHTYDYHFIYDTPSYTLMFYPIPSGNGRSQDAGYWTVQAPWGQFGWSAVTNSQWHVEYEIGPTVSCTIPTQSGPFATSFYLYQSFSAVDPEGTKHPLILQHVVYNGPRVFDANGNPENCDISDINESYTTDGSGVFVDLNTNSMRLNDGTLIQPVTLDIPGKPQPAQLAEDANGNQILNTPLTQISITSGQTSNTQSEYSANTTFYDAGGNAQMVVVDYVSIPIATNFCAIHWYQPSQSCSDYTGSRYVIHTITLPNGTYYGFSYDLTGTGELTSVQLPTGATISYTYDGYTGDFLTARKGNQHRRKMVSQRTVTDPFESSPVIWTYTGNVLDGGSSTITVQDPDGNCTDHMQGIHDPLLSYYINVEIESIKYSGCGSTKTTLLTTKTDYNYEFGGNASPVDPLPTMPINVRPIRVTTTLASGDSSKTETDYETVSTASGITTFMNPTEIRKYDFNQSTPAVVTDYQYLHNIGGANGTAAAYFAQNIVTKPTQITTYAGSNLSSPIAQATYAYDAYDVPIAAAPNAAGHDSSIGTYTLLRGNLTSVSQWTGTSTAVTKYRYDELGNRVAVVDPKNNVTTIDYTDVFADSACMPTGGLEAYSYPTTITNPLGQQDKYTYSSCTGMIRSHRDSNDIAANRSGTLYYSDSANHLTSVSYPDGGSVSYSYGGYANPLTVTSTALSSPNPPVVSGIQYDGLGRQTKVTRADGATSETVYTGTGLVQSVSNPHMSTAQTTDGYTSYAYDALGRKIYECNPDNGTSASTCQPGSSYKHWTYSGHTVNSFDEVGVQLSQTADAFGNLTSVRELGTAASPLNLVTNYSYDPLGNLQSVNQLGNAAAGDTSRLRSFTYDALSRLVCASNPENSISACPASNPGGYVTGTIGYSYDLNGNLQAKTNANGITTNYFYDSLSRLISKTYSGQTSSAAAIAAATPPATFVYDTPGISNGIGRLASEYTGPQASPIAQRNITQYDAIGRLQAEQQCPYGVCATPYTLQYNYDLAGNLIGSNNGLTISNISSAITASDVINLAYGYDSASRLNSVTSSGTGVPGPAALFSNPVYGPAGLTSAQLGVVASSPAIAMARTYDNRMRLVSENDQGQSVTIPASGSTGAITVSGSEYQGTPGTPGVATLFVQPFAGGFEICATSSGPCAVSSNAAGSISFTIDGFTATANLSSSTNSTLTYLAMFNFYTELANAFNVPGSPISLSMLDVYNPNPILANYYVSYYLQIKSNAVGSATNYPIVIDYSDDDYACVGADPTFKLVGGTDGSGLFDVGTVTATVNGISSSVTWGANDTPASIASGLASAIQNSSGGLLTATGSGGSGCCSTLTLQSTGAGAPTNYAVSVNVTDNTPGISSPSFTFTPTSSMSGGHDAELSAPSVLYGYNLAGNFAPNGNLLGYTDSVMGTWGFANGYDSLNRLVSGSSSAGPYQGQSACWSYDSFGNRLTEAVSYTSCANSPALSNWATYNANNQISSYSVPGGISYDTAGNAIYDAPNQYLYDAENRICAVRNTVVGNLYGYVYNAEGMRVAKGTLTNFSCGSGNGFTATYKYLLGPGGEQVTELAVQSGGDTWKNSNVYALGKLLATYDMPNGTSTPALHFQFADWLGTRRVQASSIGQLEETCQSLPFGEQQQCAAPAGAPSTTDDATDHHFTGKERDTESGLDYFGARYYASSMGRWVSPDWSIKATPVPYARLDNPQTLNLYAYVSNNPLRLTDIDGHGWWSKLSNYLFTDATCWCEGKEAIASATKHREKMAAEYARNWAFLNSTAGHWTVRTSWVILGVASDGGSAEAEGAASADSAASDTAATAEGATITKMLMPGGEPIGLAGSSADIREIPGGTLEDAQTMVQKLSEGGTPTKSSTYQGTGYDLPGGGFVGIRTVMTKSPGTAATIDINIPGIDISAIKFDP